MNYPNVGIEKDVFTSQAALEISCAGFCKRCGKVHSLPEGNCRSHSMKLIERLSTENRIDFETPREKTHPKCATSYLFGEARGKMFGVMECLQPDGTVTFLRAFSGQYHGLWEVDGWVPPLFDVEIWEQTNSATEKEIKQLGQEIISLSPDSSVRKKCLRYRKQLSRGLMKKLHSLYNLNNFKGERHPLTKVFTVKAGIPTGTGDCCAPKLLNYAALHNLLPLGMTEFYWGKENKSNSRHHCHVYPSCSDKCQPILGFMLCGLERLRASFKTK